MSLLFQKLGRLNVNCYAVKYNEAKVLCISSRNQSFVPSFYDGEKDPAPTFFSSNIQVLLKRLTRPDLNKVFRKRTNTNTPLLKTPQYKFLTDKQLQAEVKKAQARADRLLQMPPVVKIHKPVNDVLSKDPALVGYDTATYMFTDITFGVHNEQRIIVQRDPDGTLHSCDHEIRKRLNQVYFPIFGRKIREPMLFADEACLNRVLDKEQYEYVLDRACIQYEPDEPSYHKATSIAYQHVDANRKYELLRSTRHFGPLLFYLSWHHSIDGLMLELLQTGAIREAALLVALRQRMHGNVTDGSAAEGLVTEILPTPVQLTKPEHLTEEDIQLDSACVQCVEQYVRSNSSMRSQQELALQGFRESYQQMIELSRGLRKAHGAA